MMKFKKCLSLFLAVALLISVVPQTGSLVSASEPINTADISAPAEEEPKAEETTPAEEETRPEEAASTEGETKPEEAAVTEGETKLEETTPTEETKPEEAASTEEETKPEETTPTESVTKPEEAVPTEGETKPEEITSTGETKPEEAAPIEGEMKPEEAAPVEGQSNEPAADEAVPETPKEAKGPMLRSMIPIKEVHATVVLNGYSEEQLRAVPVSTFLEKLKDENGQKITIADDAKIVWGFYPMDGAGPILEDEYHVVERSDTFDLFYSNGSTNDGKVNTEFTMELIVGKGTQLDANSTRYIVNVYANMLSENMEYSVYRENPSGGRAHIYEEKAALGASSVLDDLGIPVTEVSYYVAAYDYSGYQEGDTCYLGMTSSIASDQSLSDIKVDVYPMKNFVEFYQNKGQLQGAITDQILNQTDLFNAGGYAGTYPAPGNADPLDMENLFCVVYTDADTGALISYQGILFVIRSERLKKVTGGIYSYENGQMKNIAEEAWRRDFSNNYWRLDTETPGNPGMVKYDDGWIQYRLQEGYSESKEYYFALDPNEQIEKVVLGLYDTKKEAETAGAEDVTAQVLPADRSAVPYGYKARFDNYDRCITIFFKNGTACNYNIEVYESYPEDDYYDLRFRVTGANGYDYGDLYMVMREALDTYYGNGYQTVLINDANADLKNLVPTFTNDEKTKVYVGTEQKSGESVQDFSNGPVQYTVIGGDLNKNYQVSFVKKESGPKLYVNGPAKREVFLTGYNLWKHNILVANVGDEKLTGLKAELLNPVNVMLDDYWTLGGADNDTLEAFTTASVTTSYAELANLAKIRLVPDGEGPISGTLKISADGQEDVYIELVGFAGNPKITTESLSEGVKYVPYSYVVSTNNMYDWNKVTFSITEGKLPEGLKLYPGTGEIYGVPKETGEFPITIRASYNRREFDPSYADLVLTVKENTNSNVYTASDAGYELKEHIGEEATAGSYDYVLKKKGDQLFVSAGEYGEFIDFWLNGEKLIEGEDYTKESGSTRITIREQTFQNKADKNGTNTIAAEFRVDGDTSNELKRTAQNFRMDIKQGGGNSGKKPSSGGGNSQSDGGQGGTGTPGAAAENHISLIVRLTNAEGNPMADTTIELHSTPKTAQTNQNGIAVFYDVEGGKHTLYIKDKNGNTLASRNFALSFGNTTSLNGAQITAISGSAVTLNIQLKENVITYLDAQGGDTYRILPAKTGDESKPEIWLALAILACGMGIWLYGRRKKINS